MKITVGIVLYNPNIERLKESINELEKHVNKIILINNNSKNYNEIIKLKNNKIDLINNKENIGISKALNQIMKYANDNQSNYLLTLDQDSILKYEMLKKMLNNNFLKSSAIVCPRIIDLNKKSKKRIDLPSYQSINRCITSGSLMNMKICNKIGMFDEKMFIDYVDFDYCKRIKITNNQIIRINDALIYHEIGKRSLKKLLFWNVYPTNHNSLRIYYYSRNIKYYLKKYKKKLSFKEILSEYIYLLWKLISIVLYEQNKAKKILSYCNGIKDSRKMVIINEKEKLQS